MRKIILLLPLCIPSVTFSMGTTPSEPATLTLLSYESVGTYQVLNADTKAVIVDNIQEEEKAKEEAVNAALKCNCAVEITSPVITVNTKQETIPKT